MDKTLKAILVFLGALVAIILTSFLSSVFNIDGHIFIVWIGTALFFNMYLQSKEPESTMNESKVFIIMIIMVIFSIMITALMLISGDLFI